MGQIIKINDDGTDKKEISDGSVGIISVKNGWIYYLTHSQNDLNEKLFRIKTDGSDKNMILDDDISTFIVEEGYIFFTKISDKMLYKIKNDGTDEEKLYDEAINEYYIFKNTIYFTNYVTTDQSPHLYSMDIDGKNIKDMKTNYVVGIVANNSNLLYTETKSVNDNGSSLNLYILNLKTLEKRLITTNVSSGYDINQDHYIYTNSQENELHIADLNGQNDKIILKDTRIRDARIRNNKIYFRLGGSDQQDDGLSYSISFDGSDKIKLPVVSNNGYTDFEVEVDD